MEEIFGSRQGVGVSTGEEVCRKKERERKDQSQKRSLPIENGTRQSSDLSRGKASATCPRKDFAERGWRGVGEG